MTTAALPPPSSADAQLASRFLVPWVAVQIAAAGAVLLAVARTVVIRPEIALPWPGLSPQLAIPLGMAFWLAFGLLGGLRARLRAGGSVMTFSMPFIVAGTLLGGPLAGALLGFVSEFELREFRTQPWYGTLANHAVSILAAVTAALVGDWVRAVTAHLLPDQSGLAGFIVALSTALAFASVNIALVVPSLAFKSNVGLREASRSYNGSYRATSVGEAILAWLMALTYQTVGWWAPIACVTLILIIWQAYDRAESLRRDEKTGLLNDFGFRPRLADAIDGAGVGRRRAALVLLDLDRFKHVNDVYLPESGDEVLRETSRRLLGAVRATDSVARTNRAGDEFTVLFENVGDEVVALRLAHRLQAAIRRPIRLPVPNVNVTVDVSIGVVVLERGESRSPDEVIRLVNSRMERAKELGSGVVASGDENVDAIERRKALKPRRK